MVKRRVPIAIGMVALTLLCCLWGPVPRLLFLLLCGLAATWETYTDPFIAINSPIKVGLQLGFLGLACMTITELRFRLGKPLPRFAAALTSIGVFCTLNGSIPVLVGTGVGTLNNTR